MQLGNTLQAHGMLTQPPLKSRPSSCAGGGWTGLAMPSPQRVFLSVLSFTALGREPTTQTTMVMTMSAYVC